MRSLLLAAWQPTRWLLLLAPLILLLAVRRPPRRLRYFVPADFEGWVHVVYTNGATGGPVRRPGWHRETYVLPASGQLVVRDPLPEAGPVEAEYYAYTPSGQVWTLGRERGPHIHGAGGMGTLAVEPTAYGYIAFYVTRRALSWEQAQAYDFPPDTLLH